SRNFEQMVVEAVKDHLFKVSGVEKPSIPLSTIIRRIFPSSSLAQTTAISAIGELVIHIFAPFKTLCEPLSTTLVSIPAGFDPWLGSVNPKQPTISPVANFGKYFFL